MIAATFALLLWVAAFLAATPGGARDRHAGETVEVKPSRSRRPARSRDDRPKRWFHLRAQIMSRLARKHPGLPRYEVRRLAERELDELYPEVEDDPVFEKFWERLRPRFGKARSTRLIDAVAIAAAFRVPQVRWLADHLEIVRRGAKTNRAGRKVQRGRVVAGLLWQSWMRGKPSIYASYQRLVREDSALISAVFDFPPAASQREYDGYRKATHAVLRGKDPAICRHLSVEFARQLSRIPARRGKFGKPFGVCEVLIVDATPIEANVSQQAFVADVEGGKVNESEYADHMRRGKYPTLTVLTYTDADGNVRFKLVGHKLLSLLCAVLNRPVIAKRIVAADTSVERTAVFGMLQELHDWFPEVRVHWLVGDALYAQNHSWIERLWREWGVCLVAPVPDNQKAPTETRNGRPMRQGVPLCTCRRYDEDPDARPYMNLRNVDDRWGPEQRAKHKVPPGKRCPGPPHGFRMRWECPHMTARRGGRSEGCGNDYTRAADHWGFVQALPLAGDSPEAKLRRALLLSRNRVESSFSALKRLGVGNKHTERAEWTNEHELDWVLGLGVMWLLLQPLIHTSGAVAPGVRMYRLAAEVLAGLGVDRGGGESNIGQDARAWARATVDAAVGPSRPPGTLDVDGTPRDLDIVRLFEELEEFLTADEGAEGDDGLDADDSGGDLGGGDDDDRGGGRDGTD